MTKATSIETIGGKLFALMNGERCEVAIIEKKE